MDSFAKRFRLYGIGLLIGIGASFFFLGDRLANNDWLPGERIKDRLESTLIAATPAAATALEAKGVTLEQIRSSMPNASVDMRDNDHMDDSLFYHVECRIDEKPLAFLALMLKDFDTDSTATVWVVD